MPTTPHKIGSKIDNVVLSLNQDWDLEIPTLHGADADRADKTGLLADKCFKRIRYLCWKTDDIDVLLSDFETRARQVHAKWTFKPSQEPGTLPVFPVVKSTLNHDIQMKRKRGLIRLSDSQRLDLLALLFEVLSDNYELAKLSTSFRTERTSVSTASSSFATAPSTPPRQIVHHKQAQFSTSSHHIFKVSKSVKTEMDEPQLKNPMTKSSKRSLASSNGVSLTSIAWLHALTFGNSMIRGNR